MKHENSELILIFNYKYQMDIRSKIQMILKQVTTLNEPPQGLIYSKYGLGNTEGS